VSGRRVALVLLIAAALLLSVSLVLGTLNAHGSPQALVWAAQFADQFRAGVLYPRWMPESFDGLGGPAFYFYPPVGFWVDALLSAATFNVLSVPYRLSVATLLLLWASGLAMHAWLRTDATSPRAALYGAVAYMAAPYHLIDHYWRGAYAEFAAYAVLPLVLLAVRHVAERRRFGLVFLTLAYAALLMTHLPTALLVSLTALPMYVLYRGWRHGSARPAIGFFVRCALGGVLGLGLAAMYLIPALALQDWISAEELWSGLYRADRWLLVPFALRQGLDAMMSVIAWAALAYGIAAIGVLTVLAQGGVRQGWRSEPAFWAFVCLLCLLLIAGAVPWFWQVPLVAKVQFSWRLMIVVEFAVVTALCLAPWYGRSRATSFIFMAAILVLAPGLAEFGLAVRMFVKASLVEPYQPKDVREYLPAGFPRKPRADFITDLGLEPLEGTPTISCAPATKVCRADEDRFGELRIEVEGDAPTTVVLRRFFFPAWRLDPAQPLVATDPLRLVSFTAPAGRHVWRLQRGSLPAEWWGWAISGLSLVLLPGAAVFSARKSSH
jgi:hypothetical protein